MSAPATRETVPHPRPRTVATNSLRANPHNPRMLFDEEPLTTLTESIRRVGILVPLTVYQATGSHVFTILDGQRRWICAQRIGLKDVPINEVAEPSVAQNIVTMFQIHKLRKDWELMPTALKLGVLMDELNERRDAPLAELTGLDIAVVSRCKKLLSYDKSYQEMMLYASPKDRVKADFFIELYPILHDRIIKNVKRFKEHTIIESLLRKYREKKSGFRSITDFRKIKQCLSTARVAGQDREMIELFEQFLVDDRMEIPELEIGTARIHREASVFVRSLARLSDQLDDIDPDTYIGEENLWIELERFVELVRKKLVAAERRSV
ncbi:MAG: ParB N-terminal domain-containing protein [Hyphomicrobiales bacterium]|nr:ParB N-terminal domain-containing protein [Hyphomicrobiales bacterium]